jgi:hypothetical protein
MGVQGKGFKGVSGGGGGGGVFLTDWLLFVEFHCHDNLRLANHTRRCSILKGVRSRSIEP